MRFGSWIASGLFHFDYLTLARLDIATTVNYCELLSLTFLCGRKDRGRGFSKRVNSGAILHMLLLVEQLKRGVQPYRNSYLLLMNGTGTRGQFIPKKAARLAPARPFTLVSPPRHHLVDAGK
jgi:hypothetical protein